MRARGAEASARFIERLEGVDSDCKVLPSVVTIHEIEEDMALLEHKGATKKPARLQGGRAGSVEGVWGISRW